MVKVDIAESDRGRLAGYGAFEQAIFIVRNDAMNRNGVTAQRLWTKPAAWRATCGRTATCMQAQLF